MEVIKAGIVLFRASSFAASHLIRGRCMLPYNLGKHTSYCQWLCKVQDCAYCLLQACTAPCDNGMISTMPKIEKTYPTASEDHGTSFYLPRENPCHSASLAHMLQHDSPADSKTLPDNSTAEFSNRPTITPRRQYFKFVICLISRPPSLSFSVLLYQEFVSLLLDTEYTVCWVRT